MRPAHWYSASRLKFSFLFLIVLLSVAGVSRCAVPHPAPTVSSADRTAHAKADYVVVRPVANMYSKPSVQSDVVSQAIYGVNVTRVRAKWHWVNVRTADQYTGWMQSSELRKLKDQPYASTGSVVRVAQLGANIYREPDVTKYAPLLTIPWESRLEVEKTARPQPYPYNTESRHASYTGLAKIG